MDTTLTKEPTSNNGLEEVIEPFSLPEEESYKAEAELDAIVEAEEERPKAKGKPLRSHAKSSFVPIKVVDVNSQEPMEWDRTFSENAPISLQQRRRVDRLSPIRIASSRKEKTVTFIPAGFENERREERIRE